MRLVAVATGIAIMCGCQQTTTINVNVTVTSALQDSITEYPVRVGFRSDMHTGGTWAICGPDEDGLDLTIPLVDDGFGCVQEPLLIEAGLAAYVPPSTGCVSELAGSYSAMVNVGLMAEGSATAFQDASASTCISKEDSVDIVLDAI